ncbi:unnamed protein product [Amoebophrya sp. A25]|nr:unnamed protein product [Amoebophrya sp. A25]|eukprot:GSA25T00024759001.1
MQYNYNIQTQPQQYKNYSPQMQPPEQYLYPMQPPQQQHSYLYMNQAQHPFQPPYQAIFPSAHWQQPMQYRASQEMANQASTHFTPRHASSASQRPRSGILKNINNYDGKNAHLVLQRQPAQPQIMSNFHPSSSSTGPQLAGPAIGMTLAKAPTSPLRSTWGRLNDRQKRFLREQYNTACDLDSCGVAILRQLRHNKEALENGLKNEGEENGEGEGDATPGGSTSNGPPREHWRPRVMSTANLSPDYKRRFSTYSTMISSATASAPPKDHVVGRGGVKEARAGEEAHTASSVSSSVGVKNKRNTTNPFASSAEPATTSADGKGRMPQDRQPRDDIEDDFLRMLEDASLDSTSKDVPPHKDAADRLTRETEEGIRNNDAQTTRQQQQHHKDLHEDHSPGSFDDTLDPDPWTCAVTDHAYPQLSSAYHTSAEAWGGNAGRDPWSVRSFAPLMIKETARHIRLVGGGGNPFA